MSFLVSLIVPKNELENSNFCPSLMGQNFFVRFLEELKKKCPLEINRPLIIGEGDTILPFYCSEKMKWEGGFFYLLYEKREGGFIFRN